jgi:hypothetical protein
MSAWIRVRIGIALLGLALGSWASTASADVTSCLAETGYAFEPANGAVTAGGGIIYLFPSELGFAYCEPPLQDQATLTAGGDTAVAGYLSGTGLSMGTGAIATPTGSSGAVRGHMLVGQHFSFTVIPDDAESTDLVPITLTTRHRFGRVRTSANGTASAGNHFEGFYNLSGYGPGWNTSGLPAVEDDVFDVSVVRDVIPNVTLYFSSALSQQSFAAASKGANPGSGAAELSSMVTYEITTEAEATIVFDLEELLGIPPPQLDVVSVPEPSLWLSQLIAVGSIVFGRRRLAMHWRPGSDTDAMAFDKVVDPRRLRG